MLLEPTKTIEFCEGNFDIQIRQLIGNDDHDLFDDVCDRARNIGILATLEGIINNNLKDYYSISWFWDGPIELPRNLIVSVSFYDNLNSMNNNDDVFIIDDSKNIIVNDTILQREVLFQIKDTKFKIIYSRYDYLLDNTDYVKLFRWTGSKWKDVVIKTTYEFLSADDVVIYDSTTLMSLLGKTLNTENAVQKLIKLAYHFL